MIGIYHSRDLDGLCSGAIMKLRYPDIKLIGYDYGEPFPWSQIPQREEIIMADVSLPMVDMAALSVWSGHQFTWIDHHISAIKDFNNYQDIDLQATTAVLNNTISACEGVWKYLFPNEEIPLLVFLLGKYDTWRQKPEFNYYIGQVTWENALAFQMGMRSAKRYNIDWICEFLSSHRTRPIDNIKQEGKAILEYQDQINETQCKQNAFEAEFEGLRAICLNGGGFNSQVFDSVWNPDKYDIMIPFVYNGKQDFWKFSLYTTKDNIDCSVIAKNFGGGGHAKASGFQVKNLENVFKKEINKSLEYETNEQMNIQEIFNKYPDLQTKYLEDPMTRAVILTYLNKDKELSAEALFYELFNETFRQKAELFGAYKNHIDQCKMGYLIKADRG